MNGIRRDISYFLLKVIFTSGMVLAILRIHVWYHNRPLDIILNTLFYLGIFFLTTGFLSILVTFLKGNNNISYGDNIDYQIEQEKFSYTKLLNLTTLIIIDGLIFMLLSFILTYQASAL